MQRLLTTVAALAAAGPALAQELNIYNWGNYTSPEMIEKFEEETGIDVTITDYDSNDTALAKIQAAATASTSSCPRAPTCRSTSTRAS